MKISNWDFRSQKEKELQEEYLKRGYIIYESNPNTNNVLKEFEWIAKDIIGSMTDIQKKMRGLHKTIKMSEVNDIRVAMMDRMNKDNKIIKEIYKHCQEYIHALCGNELAVQKRVSMSLMFPQNSKDVLPLHADTWNGVSPFELAVFIPMVDLSEEMTLYMASNEQLNKAIQQDVIQGIGSDEIYEKNRNKFERISLNRGDVLFFDHAIPHGLAINNGNHVHWALNIRFKAITSPYAEKKLGEYFMPITLKACTMIGMRNTKS